MFAAFLYEFQHYICHFDRRRDSLSREFLGQIGGITENLNGTHAQSIGERTRVCL